MKESTTTKIGWVASLLATAMYISYVDQLKLNLSGHPGSIILPIVTTINCTAWILYGALRTKKDWPLITCNIPGIIFGLATAITAI